MKGIDRNTKCPKIRSYMLAISSTYLTNIEPLKMSGTVNVYPQTINRMSSDKNKNLSTLNPCDSPVIYKLYPNKKG
jgi:hypothetical protein